MEKDTSKIPLGFYCYTIKEVIQDEVLGPRIIQNVCPYFDYKDYGGISQPFCSFLEKGSLSNSTNDEDFKKLVAHFGSEDAVFEGLPLFLLWDQVKECGINEQSKVRKTMHETFTFFWDGPFSQWYPSVFEIEGIEYNCCEQFMMAEKAKLFNDNEALDKIMKSFNPREQKKIGREVKGFIVDSWDKISRDVVYKGNMAKFTQDEELKNILLETKGTTLVEASPYDKIWGIGLKEDDPRALDRNAWLGKNWLGEVLTKVREDIIHEGKN